MPMRNDKQGVAQDEGNRLGSYYFMDEPNLGEILLILFMRPLVKCTKKIIFLFLNQNICCGYSKEPSQ